MARKKKRRKLSIFSKLLLVIISCFIGIYTYKKYDDYLAEQARLEALRLEQIEKELEAKYNACIVKEFNEEELTEEIKLLSTSLDEMLKNYSVFVYYEDINTGFDYKYRENEVVYGASLIKLVDALYLYDKNVDFNETITYESKYIKNYSSGMDKRTIGEQVSLKDLINYSLSVSDNTAHMMLIDYIGYNNLKTYGKSLGASAILSGSDKYGNQTASDTNLYLKKAYEIMTQEENGNLLRDYMSNDYQNHLYLDNEKDIAHKYGSHDIYFHDIGVVFGENPYAISILTLHGKGNYKDIINEIHKNINALHKAFNENRKSACYKEVYE